VVPDQGSRLIIDVFLFHILKPQSLVRPTINVQYQLVVAACLGRAGALGAYDGGTPGPTGGAKSRAIAIAVLLSLTFARMPGSTLR